MQYGEIQNAIDLFDEILSNEEIFKTKHPELIQITNSFLYYYTDNKVDLMELVHYSEPQSLDNEDMEDEELWVTDDEWQEKQKKPIPQEDLNSTKENDDDDDHM